MKFLTLNKKAYDKCNSAILLVGCQRSGTTILGNLVHSFKNVEYIYEPTMMYSLFELMPKLKEQDWKVLYETYLYEEFLMNALAGRNLNFNTHDDTYILKVRSEKFIKSRLSRSFRKSEAVKLAASNRIAYKIAHSGNFISKLKEYYPGTKIVVITRKAPGNIKSILEKGWFSDDYLRLESGFFLRKIYKKASIPFFVLEKDFEKWLKMDELHRAAYNYVQKNRYIENISDCLRIKHSDLLANPAKTARGLAKYLNLFPGEKTAEIMASVPLPKNEADWDPLAEWDPLLDKLSAPLGREVRLYSSIN